MRVVWIGAAALTLTGAALAQQQEQPRTVESTGKAIVEAPLKDLNIIKPKVPPLLESIMAKPYATDGIKSCGDYAGRIKDLTAVLGPDVDSKQAQAKGDKASEFALGATQDIAEGFIPGGGLIRRISGASKAQKHAAAAAYAGSVRRAFLKGSARAKGCKV